MAEKEYIEREAARDLLDMALDDDWEIEYANDRLDEIPAADVRPVVLCRDCKHYEIDNGWCEYFDVDRVFGDYCSEGVKRGKLMYEKLIKALREAHEHAMEWERNPFRYAALYKKGADAIETLTAERDKYKIHSDSISQLPNCNTCGKKTKEDCEFMPAYGDWVRINCAFGVPEQPKGECK